MHEPLLRWVDEAQALKIIQNRGQWLDVRLPSEFQNLAVEGSINIPLYFVRLKLNALDRKTPYVVVCDTGRRSSGRGVHSFRAWLRCLRVEGRHHDVESADAPAGLEIVRPQRTLISCGLFRLRAGVGAGASYRRISTHRRWHARRSPWTGRRCHRRPCPSSPAHSCRRSLISQRSRRPGRARACNSAASWRRFLRAATHSSTSDAGCDEALR